MSTLTARVPAPQARTALDHAVDEFAAAAVRADRLDPITTELVRLRCAQYHDCRVCGSLRLQDAVDEGLDEDIMVTIAQYETSDLDERAKAALRFTDAMIIRPADLDGEVVRGVREHFTDAQIAEMAVDIMKWSYQKALVALRLEEPSWEGLGRLSFDDRGDPIIGGLRHVPN